MTFNDLHPFQRQVVTLAGEFAEMFSFNRSLGQLFGFLFVSKEAISLEEVASACHMSKGNASVHLRTLEAWGAIRRSCKPGTRKDYYSVAEDLRQIGIRRVQEGLTKRLTHVRQRLQDMEKDGAYQQAMKENTNGNHWAKRVKEVESLIIEAESALKLIPKMAKLKNLFS